MTTPIRYNFELLMECMKRDNAVLDLTVYTKDSSINRNIIISGQCSCGNDFKKSLRSCYIDGGMHCKQCIKNNTPEKIKKTNLKIRGVENPAQDPKVQEKIKKTNLKVRGVEHPGQDPKVKEKRKQTNLINLGCEYPSQNSTVRDKMKETNLKVRGVEHPAQDPIVQEKMKQTNLIIRGYENSLQDPEVREKIKQTNINVRGVEHPAQDPEVKQKMKETCKGRYGYENPMQDSVISKKCADNCYKSKEYTMPSRSIRFVQGYEPFALDILLNTISEDDIITDRIGVPEIWYNFENTKHRHYIDIYIPSINKCIEVKSIYTYETDKEKVLAKQKAAKELGYQYEIWIFDNKKQLINTIM